MSTFVRSLRRYARNLNSVPFGDVFAQVYDRWARALVVRDHGKGAPSYREGEAAEVYAFTLDTTTLPDEPNTTAPTAGAGLLDVAAFGGVCLYWRPSAAGPASHPDISLSVWAQADSGNWVRVATAASLIPFVELSVPGTGYRQVFVQVTAVSGGIGSVGNIDILTAGD